MMSLLIAYALLMLLAMLWIAKDTETIYIFDVFGKNFRYVWFESGQRWTHVFTYGWRLVVLCLLVFLNGLLSYRVYVVNPLEIGPAAQLIVVTVLLAASIAPIPWISLAHRLRWQRHIRATAQRLADFVKAATEESDLARTLDRADCRRGQTRDSGLKGGREVVVSSLDDRDVARVVGSLPIDSSGWRIGPDWPRKAFRQIEPSCGKAGASIEQALGLNPESRV